MRYRAASSLVKLGCPLLSIAAAKRLSSIYLLRRNNGESAIRIRKLYKKTVYLSEFRKFINTNS